MNFNTQCTDAPICPKCGYVDDVWMHDLGTIPDGYSSILDCPECDASFTVRVSIKPTFTTTIYKQLEP